MNTPSWIERLMTRWRPRRVPPHLLDGYTQRVMDRLAPPAPAVVWRPDRRWRWAAVPALVMACALVWITSTRTTPSVERTMAQALILDHLNEPVEPVGDETLIEDAQQVDRFALAEAPLAPSLSPESLADLLNRLGEEPLDASPDVNPDDSWQDLAEPSGESA